MIAEIKDGKIYLPKELREELGEKFHIVRKDDRLVLIPVSEKPLETLQEEFEDVEKSVSELKEDVRPD